MSKTYIAETKYRTSVPRSQRLRDTVGGAAVASSTGDYDGGDYVTRTTEQIITAVKTFAAGLNITGGSSQNTLYIDANGALHCKLPIVSDSYLSGYGASAGPAGSGIDLSEVWASLRSNADDYADYKINAAHLDLSAYAPLSNPALTGIPTAPTAAPGTNTTQIATTAFVQEAISGLSGGGVSSVNGMTGNVVLDLDFIPLGGSDSIDGTLSPNRTAVYDLGSSSYKWRYVYGTYLNIDSLAVVKGGLKISGGSSVNCTFYVSGNKLHCYPEIVFDNNTFFSGDYGDLSNKPDLSVFARTASLAAVATSGDYSDLSGTPDLSSYATRASLAAVATSGSYNDLSNKPDLSGYVASSSLATVATSGSYDDLTDKPDLTVYARTTSLAAVATSGNYSDLSGTPDLTVYATKTSLATVAATGSYNDLHDQPNLSVYATKASLASVATSGSYNDLSSKPDLTGYVKTVKLNGTALTVTSNTVNVNACTSIETPTGLTAASITSAGLIKLSLTNGYTIPTTGNVAQITTNANAITALQGYFTSGVAKSAAKLNCGNVGSAALPVYFDDGVPKACTLNLSNYVDLTSPQNIPGVKTFVNGLDITGGVSDRTIYKDSNNCLHVTIPIVCDSFISAYGAGSSANVIDEMWTALAASGISHKIHADHLPYDIPPEFVAGVDDDYTGESYADVETMMIAVFERLYNLESALGL